MAREYGEHGRCEATAKSTDERCGQPATGPSGKCRFHGGASKKGAEHPNFKHGHTSKYFRSKFSERQKKVYDEMAKALGDDADAKDVLRLTATRLVLQGEHAENPALVREGRQILETFNIVANEAEMNVSLDGKVEHEHTVPDHVVDAIAGAAESHLEGGGG